MTGSKPYAGVAQLVECQLPKLNVAGSNPVARFLCYLIILKQVVTNNACELKKNCSKKSLKK